MTKPTTAVPSRTEVLNSSTSRSEGLNDTVKSDSSRQWHGRDSPRKLNTSKCILKSNLVRFELPDKGTLSQKAGSHFKVRLTNKKVKFFNFMFTFLYCRRVILFHESVQ